MSSSLLIFFFAVSNLLLIQCGIFSISDTVVLIFINLIWVNLDHFCYLLHLYLAFFNIQNTVILTMLNPTSLLNLMSALVLGQRWSVDWLIILIMGHIFLLLCMSGNLWFGIQTLWFLPCWVLDFFSVNALGLFWRHFRMKVVYSGKADSFRSCFCDLLGESRTVLSLAIYTEARPSWGFYQHPMSHEFSSLTSMNRRCPWSCMYASGCVLPRLQVSLHACADHALLNTRGDISSCLDSLCPRALPESCSHLVPRDSAPHLQFSRSAGPHPCSPSCAAAQKLHGNVSWLGQS